MSDELMDSLRKAINKIKPISGTTTNYSPVRQPLKKYKGSLVVFNEQTKEFNYY
jgi:hypothetical protein